MRVSANHLNSSLKNQLVRTLAQALADLKDIDETGPFLKDFFSESELEIFAKRLAVGYWLTKKRSYTNIKENLKVSSATIAEVGSRYTLPGFRAAIKKIEAEEWANKWAEKIKKLTI